jgi:endonuclease YncB( thermonuclease family)
MLTPSLVSPTPTSPGEPARLRTRPRRAVFLSVPNMRPITAVALAFATLATPARSEPIAPGAVQVVGGDTIQVRGRTMRLVGFDAPEAGIDARCEGERNLAARTTARLMALVAGGGLDLQIVSCSCPPGTQDTQRCNYGRACGVLKVRGRDVGAILISEGLARSYVCGATSCPPRSSWC